MLCFTFILSEHVSSSNPVVFISVPEGVALVQPEAAAFIQAQVDAVGAAAGAQHQQQPQPPRIPDAENQDMEAAGTIDVDLAAVVNVLGEVQGRRENEDGNGQNERVSWGREVPGKVGKVF
jgi:hypothetical protein